MDGTGLNPIILISSFLFEIVVCLRGDVDEILLLDDDLELVGDVVSLVNEVVFTIN